MSSPIRLAITILSVVIQLMCVSAVDAAATDKLQVKPWAKQQLRPVQELALKAVHGPDLDGKDGPMRKVGFELTSLYYLDRQSVPLTSAKLKSEQLTDVPLRKTTDGRQMVLVDATASGDAAALRQHMAQLGAVGLSVYPPIVSGWVPVTALEQLAASSALRGARISRSAAQTGLVTSQGDFAIRGPAIRPPTVPSGPTGSGITVGVISDSYNCLGGAGDDISNGELPNGVAFVQEIFDCSTAEDEGRAMLQIVADVAPNATLMFASGGPGTAGFANAVTTLANQSARVIVDDLFYASSPWFQDGVIRAVVNDAVLNRGAAYLSAANNYAARSYESPFRPSTILGVNGGPVHDFDSSPSSEDVISLVYIPTGETAMVWMQWDQPFASACTGCPGSQSDMDIYFVSAADGSIIGTPGDTDNINVSGDAFEEATFTNSGPSDYFLFVVEQYSGPAPGLIKLVYKNANLGYEDDSGSATVLGPGLAAHAIAVGAADFFETPACDVPVPQLASFSSRGGTSILFSPTGTRLLSPEIRQKPELVAPQNGDTSFFGSDLPDQPGVSTRSECRDDGVLPNFPGTSAAAPHAAGVAALLLQVRPDLSPHELYEGMKLSAIDMEGAGFDFDSGYGLVQADAALRQLTPSPTLSLSANPTSITAGASSTLTWSSTNATSCTATGSWSGARTTSGSETTGAISTTEAYTLTCTGSGGDASRTVTVTVTTPNLVAVPNVLNLTQAAAITAINGAGLVVGSVAQQASATVPSGSVISQNPVSGVSVAAGSAVNLVVSTGPAPGPVTVPNVLNLTQSAATAAIEGAGLVVGLVYQDSSATVPAGSVIGQSPQAGESVAASSLVTLLVSTGPAPAPGPVKVPNVLNLTQAAATVAINGAGLVVGTISQGSSATVPAGSVIGQSPVAGTSVAAGSAVALIVSTGPPPPAPTVSLTASPASITAGASSTLTWSSTNATSCAASGGWGGLQGTSGSVSTGALSVTTAFSLTCTGPGGAGSNTANVTVTAPPAPPKSSGGGGGGATDYALLAMLLSVGLGIGRKTKGRF